MYFENNLIGPIYSTVENEWKQPVCAFPTLNLSDLYGFEMELIDQIKKYEFIYNKYHPKHKNIVIKGHAWTKIANDLNRNGNKKKIPKINKPY